MSSKEDILLFLRENKDLLQRKYHLSKIGLFGSYARNEQTENSDIDILVEYQPNTPKLYDIEDNLRDFISNSFNRKVDICTEKWIKPLFKNLINKDVIYV